MDIQPITNHKQICRQLAPQGWQYGGFDGDYYFFQTGNYTDGFKVMFASEEDLTADNLSLMAKLGVSRPGKIAKKYLK